MKIEEALYSQLALEEKPKASYYDYPLFLRRWSTLALTKKAQEPAQIHHYAYYT